MRRVGPSARAVMLLALITALSSCVGIELRFVVQRSGAGRLELEYRVSQLATGLLGAGEGEATIPLPVSQADFETALAGADGVRLRRFSRREDENDIHISAEVSFDNFADLRNVTGFEDLPMTLTTDGTTSGNELTQRVVAERESGIVPSAEVIELVETLFVGYEVSFVVEAPDPIRSAVGGHIDEDGRTARFSMPVADYLVADAPVDFVVSW